MDAAQPSTDARQQRFQEEDLLCATGCSHLLKVDKNFLFFPSITELDRPAKTKIAAVKYNFLK